MTLTPGTRFGPYEVAALIGAGGMGEVYRAADVNLGRHVAIKVLPPSWEQDPDRVARFTREAKALASLNHPNIAAVHGFERAGDRRALVMELVEGPTLADLIAKGAMPLDEALAIARQIADALDAAHSQGIVHRDLKPANVKVRADGTVKVLDFGLAKATDGTGAESGRAPMDLPTITTPAMTELGVILGTAAYMSPEQARGGAVDTRADIWAFGCVLYEMVTGTRPFGGEHVADTLAAVIKDTPAWDRVPPRVRRLIASCLEKVPRRGDTLLAQSYDLERLRMEGEPTRIADGIATRTTVREASFHASDTGVLAYSTGMTAPRSTLQWIDRSGKAIEAAPEDNYSSLRISPDGTRVAIGRRNAAGSDDQWVLDLMRGGATRLTFDPARETYPVWSPDGAQIAFAANPVGTYQVYRMPAVGGGRQQQLTNVSGIRTIDDWSRDGRFILFSRGGAQTGSDLWALPIGATATPVPVVETPANEGEGRFSPDGKWIAYTSDQSGRVEVYVQGYPTPGERLQVSTNGGDRPVWRRDGRELFFFNGREVVAAEIRVMADRIGSGPIRPLFPFAMLEGISAPYDVSLDGQRFLALVPAPGRGDAGFTVLTNWQTTLNVR